MKKKLLALLVVTALSVITLPNTVMAYANYKDTEVSIPVRDTEPYNSTIHLNESWKKVYPTRDNNYVQKDSDDENIVYDKYDAWGVNNLNHYKVVFNPNGGSNYSVDYMTVTQYCTYGWLPGELVSYGTNEGTYVGVVRNGYHLKGWSLNAAGTQMVTEDSWVDEKDTLKDGAAITLYAQWEAADDDYHNHWSELIKDGTYKTASTGTTTAPAATVSTTTGTASSAAGSTGTTVAASSAKRDALVKAAKNKKAAISSIQNVSGRKIKVKIKKIKGYTYQIKVSTSKNFKKSKTATYTSSKNSKTITKFKGKKMTKNKTYYVKVRTVKKIVYNGKTQTVYGKWSKTKKVKIKK